MPHEPALITTIAAAFGLALIPGFVADIELRQQLAEIGVMLLMFGVGLHFSIKDLMAVRFIAVPGAIVQIATATAIGAGMVTAAVELSLRKPSVGDFYATTKMAAERALIESGLKYWVSIRQTYIATAQAKTIDATSRARHVNVRLPNGPTRRDTGGSPQCCPASCPRGSCAATALWLGPSAARRCPERVAVSQAQVQRQSLPNVARRAERGAAPAGLRRDFLRPAHRRPPE